MIYGRQNFAASLTALFTSSTRQDSANAPAVMDDAILTDDEYIRTRRFHSDAVYRAIYLDNNVFRLLALFMLVNAIQACIIRILS